MYKITYLQVYS